MQPIEMQPTATKMKRWYHSINIQPKQKDTTKQKHKNESLRCNQTQR